MIEQLLEYDTELFLFLNNLGTESWDGFWRVVTEKWSSIPLYLVLLFLIYKHYQLRGTIIIVITAALLITATDQLANLFKYVLFQRPRPCRVEALQDMMRFVADGCGRYGYLPFLLLFWAVMTAYSRIYLGVHYPLDIITGMFFGGLLGWGFYTLQQQARRKFNA